MEANLITGTNWNVIFCAVFGILALALCLYARSIPQGRKLWWVLTPAAAGLAMIGVTLGEGLARTLIIDAAAFVAVGLILIDASPDARKAGRLYLTMTLVAVFCLLLADRMAGDQASAPAEPVRQVIVWLFMLGFALKLAWMPFYFWLPGVAEACAPMSAALIISIVDMSVFFELAQLRAKLPWVFTDYQVVWIAMALISMFGGALMALGQKNMRRMLAFSTIDDMGYLLLGVVYGGEIGLTGALVGAIAHALFKVILFGALGVAEQRLGHPLTLEDHGVAALCPKAGAAYILAGLGMVGVPPLIGFAGRWRLYLAGTNLGGVGLALVMALATVLALLYTVRAIHRVWLGAPAENSSAVTKEASLASWVLLGLILLAGLLGLVPAWLLSF